MLKKTTSTAADDSDYVQDLVGLGLWAPEDETNSQGYQFEDDVLLENDGEVSPETLIDDFKGLAKGQNLGIPDIERKKLREGAENLMREEEERNPKTILSQLENAFKVNTRYPVATKSPSSGKRTSQDKKGSMKNSGGLNPGGLNSGITQKGKELGLGKGPGLGLGKGGQQSMAAVIRSSESVVTLQGGIVRNSKLSGTPTSTSSIAGKSKASKKRRE